MKQWNEKLFQFVNRFDFFFIDNDMHKLLIKNC